MLNSGLTYTRAQSITGGNPNQLVVSRNWRFLTEGILAAAAVTPSPLMLFVIMIGSPGSSSRPGADQRAFSTPYQAAGSGSDRGPDSYPLGRFSLSGLRVVSAMMPDGVTGWRETEYKETRYENQ